MTNWGAAEVKRAKTAVLVDRWYTARPNIRVGGHQGLGISSNNKPHGQIKMGVPYRASMQRYIHLLLSNGSELGRTPMTIIAMVTRLAIHPGEAEAE